LVKLFCEFLCSWYHLRMSPVKHCSSCKKEKDISEFHRRNDRRNGLQSKCKSCISIRNAAYRANNLNREILRISRWRSENPDKLKTSLKSWQSKNHAYLIARNAKREAMKIMATPAWADSEDIACFYQEAHYFGLELDHIVPLNSPLVCGLHAPHNMQLLTKEENRAKRNYHWPDMPVA
jgi:hypothetical protein